MHRIQKNNRSRQTIFSFCKYFTVFARRRGWWSVLDTVWWSVLDTVWWSVLDTVWWSVLDTVWWSVLDTVWWSVLDTVWWSVLDTVWLKNSSNRHRRAWGIELQPQNEKNRWNTKWKKNQAKKSRPFARRISKKKTGNRSRTYDSWNELSRWNVQLPESPYREKLHIIELRLRILYFQLLPFPHLGTFWL